MIYFVSMETCKLPLTFDPRRLREDLQRILPEEWIEHFNKKDYAGHWSVVPLRSVQGLPQHILPIPVPEIYANTPILDRCPYFQMVIARIKSPATSVRLMKLEPGSEIKEHTDRGLSYPADNQVRLHIPVATNSNVSFYLNGNLIPLREGECWYLDFGKPHRVINESEEARVHLVVDCQAGEWLTKLLEAG